MTKRSKPKSASTSKKSEKGSKADGPSSKIVRALLFSLYLLSPVAIALGIAFFFKKESGFEEIIPDPSFWQVVDLPGRHGKGIIAMRNISQGTLILREKPLFFVPPTIHESPEHLIHNLVSKLSAPEQRAFDALSHHASPDNIGQAIRLAKFQTNSISAGDNVGIFPRTARLNHGCSSAFNVEYSWREEEQELHVYAFKPIQKGEELLTAYTDTKRPRHERRQYLKQYYNFQCQCSVCTLPKEKSEASDKRLSQMRELKTKLGDWGNKGLGGAEATSIINKIWQLSEEEGYWSERGSLAWDATRVAASHSDETATRHWAMLAQKWLGIELGADSYLAQFAADIVEKPKTHPNWADRFRMQVDHPIASP